MMVLCGRTVPTWLGSGKTAKRCSLLVHADYDRIPAQTQHKPLALGVQTHNDAMFVLQPQVPRARGAQGEAITALSVCARKVAKAPEPVDIALASIVETPIPPTPSPPTLKGYVLPLKRRVPWPALPLPI